MTTKEMIAVMQAYEDGKAIEFKGKMESELNWQPCVPLWNWIDNDYRIKPETQYVPYDSVSEVEKDKWVKRKDNGVLKRISALDANDNSVCMYGWYNLKQLFELFTYEDGTPCGKKVEE